MRFCSLTLGCKVNQYETQAVESALKSRGHKQMQPGEGCDVCIINTCAVTAESNRKSRQAIRRMKKLEPDALIAVCGCFSQLDPLTSASLGADIVGGSGDRYGFAFEIERAVDGKSEFGNRNSELWGKEKSIGELKIFTDDPFQRSVFEELTSGVADGRTRALLKIQDGCDNYCAYCVIPYARGHARSLPLERVAEHARMLGEQGYCEIIVTGIEISAYGKDLIDNPSLIDAIHSISTAAPRARIRLGSLDPGAVSDRFCCELSKLPNLCDHFHLSLQSGCDETLHRMGRKYDTDKVYDVISLLRNRFPECGITADLIVGFPGETDAEFEQTLKFIKTAMFSKMHIFPFSARPGTQAADMQGQVPKSIKRERARIAAQAAEDMAHAYRLGQIGKTVEVLFEHERNGCWTGHSGNYLEVAARDGGGKNSTYPVKITDINDGLIWGDIVT